MKQVKLAFDHLLRWVNLTPQVAALFAFFKVVSQNVGTASVGWRRPGQIDAVLEGTNNFWSRWRSRVRCMHNDSSF